MRLKRNGALVALALSTCIIPSTAFASSTGIALTDAASTLNVATGSNTVTTPDIAWTSDEITATAKAPDPEPEEEAEAEPAPAQPAPASRSTERAEVQEAEPAPVVASVVHADSSARQTILDAAASQIGLPYIWGGTTPGVGFDCSGLVQYAYAQAGISLPRIASGQGASGVWVSDPRPGDIVYWPDHHVAIYAGNGMIYEAAKPGTLIRYGPIWGSPVYVRVVD